MVFDAITTSNDQFDDKDVMVHVEVDLPGGRPAELYCKVDTGAQGNVLPLRTFRRMFPEHLDSQQMPVPGSLVKAKSLVRLDAYNGTEIKQYGAVSLKI